MREPVWTADRIQVEVSGFFTTHHRFRARGSELGELTLPAFSKGGTFYTADGRELTMVRTSWWRGKYELHEGGVTLAHAQTRGFFRNEIGIQFGAWDYDLRRLGAFNRGWRLVDRSGMVPLEVHPQGFFKRGAVLEILGETELDLLAFSYYLVYQRWQEETAAATAAAS